MKPHLFFSTFTGVGGFEIALENNGWECVGLSEIDKFSCQVLRKQFPHIKNYGDITKINPANLPDFDLLVGGVPCTSWSIAGSRKGFEDSRGTLWFDFFNIIKHKKPKYILAENVPGLLSHDKGKSFERICECLCELGYAVDFTMLNSKYFLVAQNRLRVFILCKRLDLLKKGEII